MSARCADVEDPLRVLVADDDGAARAAIRAAIDADLRFRVVVEAVSSAAAVVAALAERPDVCVIEARLPGDGIAACREIAAQLPNSALVVLTDSAADEDLVAAVRAGCAGYLLKDMDYARLPDALWDASRGGGAAFPRRLVTRLLVYLRDPNALRRHAHRNGTALTSREWQILDLLSEGLTSRQVAERLTVSTATVRSHRSRIVRKLSAQSSLGGELLDRLRGGDVPTRPRDLE
jgi:DNA-binding NarL/FixJ family response regulator